MPNEFDGWDVKHAGTADAISNHPRKEQAIEAANLLAEHEDGPAEVVIKEEAAEPVSDTRGLKFYFAVLGGLLVLIVLIIVIVSLLASGSDAGTS